MSWQKLLAMNPLESSSSGRVEVPPWLNPLMSTISFFVGYDFYLEILVYFIVGERFEVHLVDGVARVGNKFAQKNLAIGVNRVYHKLEYAFRLRFELFHTKSS